MMSVKQSSFLSYTLLVMSPVVVYITLISVKKGTFNLKQGRYKWKTPSPVHRKCLLSGLGEEHCGYSYPPTLVHVTSLWTTVSMEIFKVILKKFVVTDLINWKKRRLLFKYNYKARVHRGGYGIWERGVCVGGGGVWGSGTEMWLIRVFSPLYEVWASSRAGGWVGGGGGEWGGGGPTGSLVSPQLLESPGIHSSGTVINVKSSTQYVGMSYSKPHVKSDMIKDPGQRWEVSSKWVSKLESKWGRRDGLDLGPGRLTWSRDLVPVTGRRTHGALYIYIWYYRDTAVTGKDCSILIPVIMPAPPFGFSRTFLTRYSDLWATTVSEIKPAPCTRRAHFHGRVHDFQKCALGVCTFFFKAFIIAILGGCMEQFTAVQF